MRASRIFRAVALAAPVTALALAATASAASADPAAAIVFRVPVTGTLDMAGLPPLAFTGTTQVSYPPTPIKPVSTVLRGVTGTGGGVTCDARGAQTFQLNPTTDTLTFTGTYKLYPPDPIRPNAACTGHQIGVQYVIHLDAAGQVIGTPAATLQCAELNCNNDTP